MSKKQEDKEEEDIENTNLDEQMYIGRVLARAGSNTLKKLETLAKTKKKKKSDIVKEAVDLYERLEFIENLDGKTLLAGLMFWKEVMGMTTELLASLSPIFSSALVRNEVTMLQEMLANIKPPEPQELPKNLPENPDPMADMMNTMKMNLMKNIMKMVMDMMTGLVRTPNGGFNQQSTTTLTDLMNSQSTNKQNVKVEIDENA